MSRLLVLDDGKNKNIWFENFFKQNYKKIGIKLSAGTDSVLLLFFLAKFITEIEQFDRVIYPWSGIQLKHTYSKAERHIPIIIEKIHKMYPKVLIKRIKFDRWMPENSKHKDTYVKEFSEKFVKDNTLDILLSGINANPTNAIMKLYSMYYNRPTHRDKNTILQMHSKDNTPWIENDKKFIAAMYKKYNLMDSLFPLTESCYCFDNPCKKCFPCREKYWAFGMYDGGIE